MTVLTTADKLTLAKETKDKFTLWKIGVITREECESLTRELAEKMTPVWRDDCDEFWNDAEAANPKAGIRLVETYINSLPPEPLVDTTNELKLAQQTKAKFTAWEHGILAREDCESQTRELAEKMSQEWKETLNDLWIYLAPNNPKRCLQRIEIFIESLNSPPPVGPIGDDDTSLDQKVDSMTTASLERLEQRQTEIKSGDGKVQPGQPLAFTPASTPGDTIWQGDVAFTVTESVPKGYTPAEVKLRQVAKGNTKGSRHEIADLSTCDVYLPENWKDVEALDGPYILAKTDTTVDHPQHGAVTIPGGMGCKLTFQQNLDAVTRRAQRARD